jgi:hypothetical protein
MERRRRGESLGAKDSEAATRARLGLPRSLRTTASPKMDTTFILA